MDQNAPDTYAISIHALAKRATLYCTREIKPTYDISIHALAKRATNDRPTVKTIKSYFNPRPRKEGDLS